MPDAELAIRADAAGRQYAMLSGDWTLASLPPPLAALDQRLQTLSASNALWDLQAVARLDSVGALLLWRAWGRRWPAECAISPAHRAVIERTAALRVATEPPAPVERLAALVALGRLLFSVAKNLREIITLIG